MSTDATTSDPWSRAEEIFLRVLELPPQEAPDFLRRACQGDADLESKVHELLQADANAEGKLEDVIRGAAESWLAAETPAETSAPRDPVRRIGPFQLLREIGRGGISSVFLAERRDQAFQQQVAIKLLRRGMDTNDILHRFRGERQILANLDHPHIARLHDGGTTDEGLPYFVLEYIDGLPIDQYCDQQQLTVEQRLRLFHGVCDAVQYAHRNLVVHRDLKPSNILVTADGTPKLLDFGIAKVLGPSLPGLSPRVTTIGLRPMTPAYASPEQVSGGAITTASDVYSLGVLLYELLTGRRPYAAVEVARDTWPRLQALEEAILHHTPEAPSRALVYERMPRCGLSVPQLRRRLRGDLDTIVLMALRKEPARRYASVEQLARDIDHHLRGHPVRAHRDSLGYRAGKFLRRHRLGVAAAVAFFLLLLTFAITMAVQSARVRAQRDRAEQVSALVTELFNIADPSVARGTTVTARELLDRGTREVRTLDPGPETARLLEALARLYGRLGLSAQSLELTHDALTMRRETLGEENAEVANSLFQMSIELARMGDYATAEVWMHEALDLRRRLFGADHPEVHRVLASLALLQHDQGHYARADDLYQQALDGQRRTLGDDDLRTAHTLSNLALLQRDRGYHRQAEALLRQVLDVYRSHLGDDDTFTAGIVDELGVTLRLAGDTTAAEPLLRQALERRLRLLGDEHDEVGRSLLHLGEFLCREGDASEGEARVRRALELFRSEAGDSPLLPQALAALGHCRDAIGDHEQALDLLRQAVEAYGAALSPRHPLTLQAEFQLAELWLQRADCARAMPLLRRTLELRQGVLRADHPELLAARRWLLDCGATGPEARAHE